MTRLLRITLVILALVALAASVPRAQGGAVAPGQPPAAAADTQGGQAAPPQAKPADAQKEEDLPADYKAWNAASREKDAARRIEAFEKFIADFPKSEDLIDLAKGQMQTSIATSFRDSKKKYLDAIAAQVEDAKKQDLSPIHSTLNRFATQLMQDGLLEDAEKYARESLASMDQQKYFAYRKAAYERSLENAKNPRPASAGFTMMRVDGAMQVKPAPPRPASATPPRLPTMPTDEEMRRSFGSDRAATLANLGQVLMKREKDAEGIKYLKEAYAAKPASSVLATVARLLAADAKKTGNEKDHFEYLTVLALGGRITADEQKDFHALYAKNHGGSLAGLEEMLDKRYLDETPDWVKVTPFTRKATSNQRVVLAEIFAGAG